jgi:hypothetical protein
MNQHGLSRLQYLRCKGLARMSSAKFEEFVKARRNGRKQPVGRTPAAQAFDALDALDLEEEANPLVRDEWERENKERIDSVCAALVREWELEDLRKLRQQVIASASETVKRRKL